MIHDRAMAQQGRDRPETVVGAYQRLVADGRIRHDPVQAAIAARLDRVLAELDAPRPGGRGGPLGWLFGRRRQAPVRGLYVHGSVGRGKTMLMDLFFERVGLPDKRRVHFNDFMADVHDRIGAWRRARKAGEVRGDDPIPPVAAALAAEARVLCFDEFSVTDIADAMILARLFTALFGHGVTLVATSNVAPDDLYRDGLNRGLFLPFIKVLREHAEVVALDAGEDYRLDQPDRRPVYLSPLGPSTARAIDEAWQRIAAGGQDEPVTITVMGRQIEVPRAVGRAARFDFADLCGRPLAARDYLALAERFDTFVVENVPRMDLSRRNEAKRFILLIDTLYDRRCRLIISADGAPAMLYRATQGNEAFEFERTASRLIEMQGSGWPPPAPADLAEQAG